MKVEDYKVRIGNLYNERPHGLLHQIGDKLTKSFRAVGVESGVDGVDYNDIRGDVTQEQIYYQLALFCFLAWFGRLSAS